MNNNMKRTGFFLQVISFFCISGIGWIIDFSVYICITHYFSASVKYANMISSLPAITYVFIVSTRKTFSKKIGKVSLPEKYAIYALYQLLLVTSISLLGEQLYLFLAQIDLVQHNVFLLTSLKLIIKIIITPITMTCNFIVMKFLIEKL